MTVVLVVDLAAVLDTSKVGKEASSALERRWRDAEKKPEAEKQKLLGELQGQRDSLRGALLARAKPVVEALAREKKATLVLERTAVLWGATEDVTAQVISRVDAGGPL